jgi:hypothetical protein
MAGTIVVDRLESDASYASSINVASPMVVSNTINMTGGSITGNVNFSDRTLFINSVGTGRVGIGAIPANTKFEITANTTQIDMMQFNDTSATSGVRSWRIGPGTGLASRFVIRDATNGSNPFSIDFNGNVFKPLQTSFFAYKSGANQTVSTTSATKITYESTSWNLGNGYNTSTSRFTAPVSGIYFFVVNYNPYQIDSGFNRLSIQKNGTQFLIGAMNYPDNSGDHTYSVSFFQNLSTNDYIEIYTQTNSDSSYGLSGGTEVWNNFAGYLLG